MTGSKRIMKRERLGDVVPPSIARNRQLATFKSSVSDTLYNLATGMGGSRDKQTQTAFAYTEIGKAQLEAAYRGDWISRKIVDIPAYDATREWRTWQGDADDITALEDLEKKLGIRKKVMMALQRARLYGGGALVLGVDQGLSTDPIDVEGLKEECLKWVHPVSRYELTAGPIDWNLASPYFGTPAYYERSIQHATSATAATAEEMRAQAQMNARMTAGGMIRLHPSRVVRFVGREPPEWNLSQGWGDSVLGVVADAVLSLGTVSSALTALVHEAKLDVVKVPELSERISDAAYEAKLQERFATANMMKSLFSILLLDKEEEWERVTQIFTGMPEILQAFVLMVTGAADIPATRFMGQSPQGMNATGDSDTRNYYDRVATSQNIEITPAMEILDKIIQVSALGKIEDEMFYIWNPLWQMDEVQKAEVAVKQADVMTKDVAAGLLDPMVLQKARENQLIESGFYPGIEQIIEEFGTDIDEREAEAAPGPAVPMIDPETGLPPDPADPEAAARAIPDPDAPPPQPPGFGAPPANENVPPPPPGQKKAANDVAINAMSRRIKDAITDASTPRTLYIYRAVLNYAEIAKHYADQGVDNVITSEQHVTIMYSKTPVDWLKIGSDDYYSPQADEEGRSIIKAGGPRVDEKFGNYLVLAFASSDLSWRHRSILERAGASWDWGDYTPHVSISKNPGAVDIMGLKPWTGAIILGPETFEEIKPEYFKPATDKKMSDSLTMVIDAIRNMPAPQVHVTVKNGRVIKEDITIQHDEKGRAIGAKKIITETSED
jgi:phage-related protein (TIGR01555 family)